VSSPGSRTAAAAAAAAFLVAGVLGLTSAYRASTLLDSIHLAFAAAGVAAVALRSEAAARRFLTLGGTASLVLWLLGAAAAGSWIPLRPTDNWLHLALGTAFLGLAELTGGGARPAPGASML
jgi:hypothetical protein